MLSVFWTQRATKRLAHKGESVNQWSGVVISAAWSPSGDGLDLEEEDTPFSERRRRSLVFLGSGLGFKGNALSGGGELDDKVL